MDFQSLHPDLKAVHGLNSCLCTSRVVKAHKTKALALVGGAVHENLGGNDSAEGQEHLHELVVSELLWQVVDEEVTALWTFSLLLLLDDLGWLGQCLANGGQRSGWVDRCVLLHPSEGLLQGISSCGALGGVWGQAVGVDGLHSRVSVGLMRNAGEAVDDGRDDAGHGGCGDVGWWRTETCWEK